MCAENSFLESIEDNHQTCQQLSLVLLGDQGGGKTTPAPHSTMIIYCNTIYDHRFVIQWWLKTTTVLQICNRHWKLRLRHFHWHSIIHAYPCRKEVFVNKIACTLASIQRRTEWFPSYIYFTFYKYSHTEKKYPLIFEGQYQASTIYANIIPKDLQFYIMF